MLALVAQYTACTFVAIVGICAIYVFYGIMNITLVTDEGNPFKFPGKNYSGI